MKTILQNLQIRLNEVSELKYIDEDWGQLDYYSAHPPVQYPLVLLDIAQTNYSNLGVSREHSSNNRQMANATLTVTIANLKLTNSSIKAPTPQKEQAWFIYELIEKIHERLHGYAPDDTCSKLIRNSLRRIKRDDGIQEYELLYNLTINNV